MPIVARRAAAPGDDVAVRDDLRPAAQRHRPHGVQARRARRDQLRVRRRRDAVPHAARQLRRCRSGQRAAPRRPGARDGARVRRREARRGGARPGGLVRRVRGVRSCGGRRAGAVWIVAAGARAARAGDRARARGAAGSASRASRSASRASSARPWSPVRRRGGRARCSGCGRRRAGSRRIPVPMLAAAWLLGIAAALASAALAHRWRAIVRQPRDRPRAGVERGRGRGGGALPGAAYLLVVPGAGRSRCSRSRAPARVGESAVAIGGLIAAATVFLPFALIGYDALAGERS